jgi:hypothetical protein
VRGTTVPTEPSMRPDRSAAFEHLLGQRGPGGPSNQPELVAIAVGCVGLLIQVVGYSLGWSGSVGPPVALWYLGFLLIVAPFAWLLLVPGRTGRQRLGASLVYSLLIYGSYFLSNPLMATRFDEMLHVSTLVSLVDESRFFQLNTMLPVSPHFPGLELATAGIHWLTGLPLIACQFLVVLTARATFVLALFLLAARIGRSPLVGATAVFLYSANPQFYFFNAQYSYQTVAIAMSLAAFYLLTRAFDSSEHRPWRELLAVQLCFGALVVTHHLTSWLLLGALWALAVLFLVAGERRRGRLTLVTAEIATMLVAAWTAVIAPLLLDYLGPIFDTARSELLTALDGEGTRSVGAATDGSSAPTWEIMLMAGSLLIWAVVLLPAAFRVLRGDGLGTSRGRYLPLAVALLFPGLQLARLSEAAAEVSDRASTFVYMALALVVGVWLASRLQVFKQLVVPAAIVLVLGGTLIGSGPDMRLVPGPFVAGAQQRGIDSTSIAVAQWSGTYMPKGSRIASDSALNRLLPNYGEVVPVTNAGNFSDVTPMFLSTSLNQESLSLILHNDIDFLVLDTRLVGAKVKIGSFFEGSSGYGPEAVTVQAAQFDKFANQPGFDLVLDGPVKIYDVRPLRGAPQTFAHRDTPGLPGAWTPWQVGLTLLLLLVGLALRGRLLDPRRFHARDFWRVAVVLPIVMVLGAAGVATGFPHVAGGIAAVVLLYVLVAATNRPASIPAWPTPGEWRWSLAITVTCTASIALAVWSAWHGLLDFTALPPPTAGGSS